jgi:hypothetical protein
MVAEDIRDLRGGTSHERRGLCRRLLLRCQRREPSQRAHDRADHAGGYLRVERGGIELGMSERTRAIMLPFYVIESQSVAERDRLLADDARRSARDKRQCPRP